MPESYVLFWNHTAETFGTWNSHAMEFFNDLASWLATSLSASEKLVLSFNVLMPE
jgi:hypothetical protein